MDRRNYAEYDAFRSREFVEFLLDRCVDNSGWQFIN